MMNTIDRLRLAFTSGTQEEEKLEEDEDLEIEPTDYDEPEIAKLTAFGRKLGNFPYKFVPEEPRLMVRGLNYLEDKVKIPSSSHKFDCVGCDVYAHEKVIGNITKDWQSGDFPTLKTVMSNPNRKIFVHFLVPGSPNLTATFYFVAKNGVFENDSKFARLFDKFASPTLPDENGLETKEAADEFRTKTLKIIPRFVKGASMAKRLAGEKPAIICRKIPSRFYVGDNFVEVNLDISGSRIAKAILGLVKKQLRGIILDLVFLLEGKNKDELPEELLGGLRFQNPSLDNVEVFTVDPV